MKLLNRRYEEIKESVTNLFALLKVKNIPIDVFQICQMLGIRLVKYSEMTTEERRRNAEKASKDGFYALIEVMPNKYLLKIYYNETMLPQRIRFTIMHELGHIFLNHKEHSDVAEAEADFFAKYALAPPPIVHLTRPSDYLDIAYRFDLSADFAWNAMEYYKKWYAYHRNDKPSYELTLLSLFAKSVS